MKAFLIVIGVLVVLLVGGGVFMVLNGSDDLYEEVKKVNYDEVNKDNEGVNMYYYYQVTCTHCQTLKPYMKSVQTYNQNNDDFDLYFVDAATSHNAPVFKSDENFSNLDAAGRLDYINKEGTYYISGTPTLVVEKDGVATDYLVGTSQISSYFVQNYGIEK